ncbi:MAG: hypothetical protein IKE43_11720 [Coriobacteriales bacterium]|nr:hypothetical protein [Coriobacteriales bacterium]
MSKTFFANRMLRSLAVVSAGTLLFSGLAFAAWNSPEMPVINDTTEDALISTQNDPYFDAYIKDGDSSEAGVLSVTRNNVTRVDWEGTLQFRVLRAVWYDSKEEAIEKENLTVSQNLSEGPTVVIDLEVTNVDATPFGRVRYTNEPAFTDSTYHLVCDQGGHIGKYETETVSPKTPEEREKIARQLLGDEKYEEVKAGLEKGGVTERDPSGREVPLEQLYGSLFGIDTYQSESLANESDEEFSSSIIGRNYVRAYGTNKNDDNKFSLDQGETRILRIAFDGCATHGIDGEYYLEFGPRSSGSTLGDTSPVDKIKLHIQEANQEA